MSTVRHRTGLVLLVGAVLLAACSHGSTRAVNSTDRKVGFGPPPGGVGPGLHLTVDRYGFGSQPSSGYTWLAAEITNRDQLDYAYVSVVFTAYAASGQVLTTTSVPLALRAGQASAVGAPTASADGPLITRLNVEPIRVGSDSDPDPSAILTAGDAVFSAGGHQQTVTGTVTSHYSQPLTGVQVEAVCTDRAGRIIGGGSTQLGPVAAGASVPATVSVLAVSEVPRSCQLYPTAALGVS